MLGYKVGYARLPGAGCPDGWPGLILGRLGDRSHGAAQILTAHPQTACAQRASARKSTGPRNHGRDARATGSGGNNAE
jgi:hypothetical protein